MHSWRIEKAYRLCKAGLWFFIGMALAITTIPIGLFSIVGVYCLFRAANVYRDT